MNKVLLPAGRFSQMAAVSFERTFTKLFEQSFDEAERLERVNSILRDAEISLQGEDIDSFGLQDRLILIDILVKSKKASSEALIAYSEVFKNVKNVVGLMESIHRSTAIPGELEDSEFDDIARLPGLS